MIKKFCLLLLLTSCGYHLEQGSHVSENAATLSVPFVKGDINGRLTEAIIKQIAYAGDCRYVSRDGDYLLEIDVLSDSNDQIGYMYDHDPTSGKLIKRLEPNEGRREMTVDIRLINATTNEVILSSTQVSAYSDFDFVDSDSIQDVSFTNLSGARDSVLSFSLGQLDSKEGALDAASHPLYQEIGKKIAMGLQHH